MTKRRKNKPFKEAGKKRISCFLQWNYDLSKITIPIMMITGTKGDFETKLEIPIEKMRRFLGLQNSMYSGFLTLGMTIWGPVADRIPLQWVMIASGIIVILMTFITKKSIHE